MDKIQVKNQFLKRSVQNRLLFDHENLKYCKTPEKIEFVYQIRGVQ